MRQLQALNAAGAYSGVFGAAAGFAALFILFALLETLFPEKREQGRWRRGSLSDSFWWFAGYATRFVGAIATLVAVAIVARLIPHPALPAVSRQPMPLQLLEVFLLSDLIGYWVHRAFHGRRLWPIHAVHHSIEDLDWLSAARVHPLDTIIHRPLETVPIFMLGFSSLSVLPIFAFVIAFYPIFIHANLPWSYGPLRGWIASPGFHRWHHTAEAEGIDKNFAGLFPFWDRLFGTYHMPGHASPSYGLGGGRRMSLNPLRQLLSPVRSAIR